MSSNDGDQKSDGQKLVDGLNQLIDERTPDDEHHCPNCGEYAEFDVLQTVERTEFGVENDVIGCPNCQHTTIDATEWRSVRTGTDRAVPVGALEKFIQEKKDYADFIETTAAPDGVASEVRDCAKELEMLVEERSVDTGGER